MSQIHERIHTRSEQLATEINNLQSTLASRGWDRLVRTTEFSQASKVIEGRIDEQESTLFQHKRKLSELRAIHDSSHPICLRIKAAVACCRLALRKLYSAADEEEKAFKVYQEDFDFETRVFENKLATLTLDYFEAGGKVFICSN